MGVCSQLFRHICRLVREIIGCELGFILFSELRARAVRQIASSELARCHCTDFRTKQALMHASSNRAHRHASSGFCSLLERDVSLVSLCREPSHDVIGNSSPYSVPVLPSFSFCFHPPCSLRRVCMCRDDQLEQQLSCIHTERKSSIKHCTLHCRHGGT